MKIAIPTIGEILDEFFKSCEVFTIFTIDDSYNITDTEILYTPEGCDCKNNIPLILQQKRVSVILAYKVPEHADEICSKPGIELQLEYSGKLIDVVDTFLLNKKK